MKHHHNLIYNTGHFLLNRSQINKFENKQLQLYIQKISFLVYEQLFKDYDNAVCVAGTSPCLKSWY